MKKTIALSLAFWLFCGAVATAQDLHFSQFMYNTLRLNPAMAGVHEGAFRADIQYRNQWQRVPVPYNSFAASADWKLLRRSNNLVAAGLTLEHDRAGDAALVWNQVALNISAAHAISEGMAVSTGLGLGLAQRSFDISKLTFKNQWTGDVYDGSLPTKEAFGRQSGLIPNLSAGANLHIQRPESRTFWDVGVAAAYLNRPDVSFLEDAAFDLPMRFNIATHGTFEWNEYWDLVAFGLAQQMGTAREWLAGAGLRMWLSRGIARKNALQLTLAYRGGDALVPALRLEHNDWAVGLSYDLNLSKFDVATQRRGGPEIAITYQPIPAPPIKVRKVCPIF
jgi:type IX secretion system PorP/SprF family membrane protein